MAQSLVLVVNRRCWLQGTVCHEAAMAVGKLGGTDAFFAFSDELFKVAPVSPNGALPLLYYP